MDRKQFEKAPYNRGDLSPNSVKAFKDVIVDATQEPHCTNCRFNGGKGGMDGCYTCDGESLSNWNPKQ